MKRPKQRTRQSSTQNYRRSKVSYQGISSKKTPLEIGRNKNGTNSYEEMQKLSLCLLKPPVNLSSSSWCIFDEKNNQFIGFRQAQQREVASLTKIMTTILALNLISRYELDKDIAVRISRSSSALSGTTSQLKYGKWVRLQDLLYGSMLPSGNDSAYLVSEVLGLLLFYERMKPEDKQYVDIESVDITLYDNTIPFVNRFLKEMNKLAKQIKMNKTSFANPHGLSNVLNFSTAKDMLELTKYACANKDFVKIMGTEEYACDFYNDDFESIYETKVWKNTNKMLRKGWEGVKTGQTPSAGSCLASLKQGIYIIMLNCCSTQARFTETEVLYEWYRSNKQQELTQEK